MENLKIFYFSSRKLFPEILSFTQRAQEVPSLGIWERNCIEYKPML
jgi:hypothetical protein